MGRGELCLSEPLRSERLGWTGLTLSGGCALGAGPGAGWSILPCISPTSPPSPGPRGAAFYPNQPRPSPPGAAAGPAAAWWGSWLDPEPRSTRGTGASRGSFAEIAPWIARSYPFEGCKARCWPSEGVVVCVVVLGGFVQPLQRYNPAPIPNAHASRHCKNREARRNRSAPFRSTTSWATK